MPLVRISLVKGKPEAYRRKVGEIVYDSNDLGIARSSDLVIVQITLSAGWSFGNGEASYAPAEAKAA